MKYIISLLLLFIFTIPQSSFAQEKREREIYISPDLVPIRGTEFVEKLQGVSDLQWYKEFSNDIIFYEVKLKLRNDKYSIKFDSKGDLFDVEKTVPFEELKREEQSIIDHYFEQNYEKTKIIKIQYNYEDAEECIIEYLNQVSSHCIQEPSIEIEFSGEIDGRFEKMEILFSSEGTIRSKRKIIEPPNDLFYY